MKNWNVVLVIPFFIAILFTLTVPTHAIVWAAGAPSNPPPNVPIQQQQVPHEEHPNGPSHAGQSHPQPHQQAPQQPAAPSENHPQNAPATQDQHKAQKTLNHQMQAGQDWHNYIRRDYEYYDQDNTPYPVADVDVDAQIPDGYETVNVNGQIYYYSDGVFYQLIAGSLTPIQPVIGAIVSNIPTDYQIVMAGDGQHYLATQGVYYQRIDQGFVVVAPPDAPDA